MSSQGGALIVPYEDSPKRLALTLDWDTFQKKI